MRVFIWTKALFIFYSSPKKDINYVSQLSDNGSIKKWYVFKVISNQWIQLIDPISERWKFINKEKFENATNHIIHDHHLIKSSRVATLDKIPPSKKYSILISILISFFLQFI